MLSTVVIFLLVECLCKNKALGKLKEEFATSEFRVECRPDPRNPDSVKLDARQVGYKTGRDAMDSQDEAEERALLKMRICRDCARKEREDLEEEEHILDMARRKAMVEEKRNRAPIGEVEMYGQHDGASLGGGAYQQRSHYYSWGAYGDEYQDMGGREVPVVNTRAMVHAPAGCIRGQRGST